MTKKTSRRGLIPVLRTLPADEASEDEHQPINTAREKQQRQQWYRDTCQGIRGVGTR